MEAPWYVLRDLARPNAKNPAYRQLQEMPCMKDCVFIPLRQRIYVERGKRVIRLIPYMNDLIFVHKTKDELDPIISSINLLQYRYIRGASPSNVMSIPHQAMQQFINAVQDIDLVEYYSYDQVSPQLYGKHVRIIGGNLNGMEGRLMSKRGSKCRRLLIDLHECNLSAAVQVESEYIQLLK